MFARLLPHKLQSILPRRAQPAAVVPIRRVHRLDAGKGAVAPADATVATAQIADALHADAALRHDLDAIEVTSEQSLPAWRGLVGGVVRDSEHCVVLDLEFLTVMVLGTPEHFGSGNHNTLLSTLRSRGLSVEAEKTATREVIAAVRTAATRKLTAPGARASTDEANVQLYKDLLSGAYQLGGSDLHILLDIDARSTVKVRIDGKSRHWRAFDTDALRSALAAGYQALSIRGTNSNSDWTIDRPINTITRFFDGATMIHGRLTTQPVTGGCKITIRVSDGDTNSIATHTLQDSGFTDEQIQQQILPALEKEKGFVLVGGSTGAGKTTTLQRIIMAIPGRESKEIYTVDDPNEARIPGVAHHSIQRNTDDSPEQVKLQFDSAFMTQMRMDPDIIVVNEIRDRTSASLATDAVMTGHLLAVTMHGNSAIGQLFRLMSDRIGIEPDVLADEEHFVLSMSQYLVPTLCAHCKVPAHAAMADEALAPLRSRWQLDTARMYCASGTGCTHCTPEGMRGDGESGRTVAAEIITRPTPEFLQCLLNRDRAGATRAWRQTRRAGFDSPDMQGKTSYENALYHVAMGRVSPLALAAVFGKHFDEIDIVEIPGVLRLASERAA